VIDLDQSMSVICADLTQVQIDCLCCSSKRRFVYLMYSLYLTALFTCLIDLSLAFNSAWELD
jgi:hypothetical protein